MFWSSDHPGWRPSPKTEDFDVFTKKKQFTTYTVLKYLTGRPPLEEVFPPSPQKSELFVTPPPNSFARADLTSLNSSLESLRIKF